MKNMKIPVENNLNEIVGELERLGYHGVLGGFRNTIITSKFGKFSGVPYCTNDLYLLTTLAELKKM